MVFSTSRFASLSAMAAALAMSVTPAAAMPLAGPSQSVSVPAAGSWSVESETAHRSRWGGHRSYRGWGRHHHGGIDGGDILAGVLIIGGIAAIASAAGKANRERDSRYPDERDGDYRNRDDRDDGWRYRDDDRRGSGFESRGMDRAADICVREVERQAPVDEVNGVNRTGGGWRVRGRLENGRDFTCSIGNDGRVEAVDLDASVASGSAAGQWDDDAYARARAARDAENGAPSA